MRKQIIFVTGNANKLREVREILAEGSELPVDIEARSVDVDEIQGTIAEVAIAKCKRAAELTGLPTLTEDTALCFNALNGLPGPYIKYFLQSLGGVGLNKMLDGFEDRGAEAVCTFAYCPGPGEPVQIFDGHTPGHIVMPRGPGTFGWDNTFQPIEGQREGKPKMTYAEMSSEDKNKISHRGRALEKLKAFLLDM